MANMSYCRFTNTRGDLQDCLDAIQQSRPLSTFEARAGRDMFNEFLELCQEYNIIDIYDSEAVDELFNSLEESNGDGED